MASRQSTAPPWTTLSGDARTLLYIIAQRERDGVSTTRADIEDAVSRPRHPGVTPESLLGCFQQLETAGLIEATTSLDPYQVTPAGRDLLVEQSLHIESVITDRAADQVDSLAVCPVCGNPITALTATNRGALRASHCECRLADTTLDPGVSKLVAAFQAIDDRDAAHYLRQAIYLLLPRDDG